MVKYNKDGIVQCATLIGNNALSNAYQDQTKTSITIDSSGNPWISGSYVNPTGFYVFSSVNPGGLQLISLTPIQPVTALNGRNGFIAKYSQDLQTLLGFTTIGMEQVSTDVQITGIASYGTDVFVVGTAFNTSATPYTIKYNSCQVNPSAPPPFILIQSATSSNVAPSTQIATNFIAWYSSGCVFKKQVLIQSTSVISRSIDVDNVGSVYITGTYYGSLGINNSGPPTPSGLSGTLLPISGGSNPDGFIIKYTTTSTPSISLDRATTIAKLKFPGTLTVDRSSSPNYVALTGIIPSGGIDFNNYASIGPPGVAIQTTPYGSLAGGVTSGDAFVAKYTTQGAAVWATAERGPSSDAGTGVTTDSDGNVVVCGLYRNGNLNVLDFASSAITTTLFGFLATIGVQDSFIAKYMKNTGSVLNA